MRGLYLAVLAVVATGCAVSDIARINQRLKEENDKLLLENRSLAVQAQQARQELDDEKLRVAQLRQEVAELQRKLQQGKTAVAPASARKEEELAAFSAEPFQGLKHVDVIQEKDRIRLVLSGKTLFAPGSVTLSTGARSLLRRIGALLKQHYPMAEIRVDGHTDNTPIKETKDRYPSNWELSAYRACAVARFLVQQGISPQRIFAAGFSYWRPVASNNTPRGREKNRRIEIVILRG